MCEETDSTRKYRLRSLEEILAPYADPETWREQLDDVQNPEIRALFEERLQALESAPPDSPEAAIRHMLAPLSSTAATPDGTNDAELGTPELKRKWLEEDGSRSEALPEE